MARCVLYKRCPAVKRKKIVNDRSLIETFCMGNSLSCACFRAACVLGADNIPWDLHPCDEARINEIEKNSQKEEH